MHLRAHSFFSIVFQHVSELTFQTAVGELIESPLDLIICDDFDRVDNLVHLPPLGNLAKVHHVLAWILSSEQNISQHSFKRLNFQNGDLTSISGAFNAMDWRAAFDNGSVDFYYNLLIDKYNHLCALHIPLKRKYVGKNKNKWMANDLRQSLKQQHKFWYKCSANKWKDPDSVAAYVKLAKTNKKWLLRCVSEYEYNLAEVAKK